MPLGHKLIIHLKKVFIRKEKKKPINVLTAFFIFPIKVVSKLS